jgi:hypothetical protein
MLTRDEFLAPVRSLNSWIIIHELYDKTFNWNRPWNDFKIGFGQLGLNYWFGLEKLHQLTAAVPCKVRMDFRLTSQSTIQFIQMAVFSIGDEASHYQLAWSGMTVSDASITDSLFKHPETYHNGLTFSTYDNNRAFDIGNYQPCPSLQGGGWWFKDCYALCLTCVGNLGFCPSGGGSFNAAGGTLCADFVRMAIAAA